MARPHRDDETATPPWSPVPVPGSTEAAETVGATAVGFAVRAFLVVSTVLVAVVASSVHLLPRFAYYWVPGPSFPGSWLLEGWVRYDSSWYREIVTNGYHLGAPGAQADVAYFPGYPLAMWVVTFVTHSTALAGIVVTFVSGLAAVLLFRRWLARRVAPATGRLAIVLLLVYPFAWYLVGAVYADALFLALALGAFLLLEADHPVWAGVVGALATATRPIGAALVVGLVLVAVERRGGFAQLHSVRRADLGVLLSAAGFVSWSAYQGVRWGDPLLFTHIESAPGWDQGAGPRTWLKVGFFGRVRRLPGHLVDSITRSTAHGPHPWAESTYALSILLQALLLVGALLLARTVWQRFGWGYGGYVVAVVAVAGLGTKDFLGVGRYLLAAFPAFGALAVVLGHRPRARVAWLVASSMMLGLLASGYARGYYLA